MLSSAVVASAGESEQNGHTTWRARVKLSRPGRRRNWPTRPSRSRRGHEYRRVGGGAGRLRGILLFGTTPASMPKSSPLCIANDPVSTPGCDDDEEAAASSGSRTWLVRSVARRWARTQRDSDHAIARRVGTALSVAASTRPRAVLDVDVARSSRRANPDGYRSFGA